MLLLVLLRFFCQSFGLSGKALSLTGLLFFSLLPLALSNLLLLLYVLLNCGILLSDDFVVLFILFNDAGEIFLDRGGLVNQKDQLFEGLDLLGQHGPLAADVLNVFQDALWEK